MDRYYHCFYSQGEEAQHWLDVLDHEGAANLLREVDNAGLGWLPENGESEVLSQALNHELIGDFAITHSHNLQYLGISKRIN